MKHNFTKAALVAACLLGVAGLAQAGTSTQSNFVVVNVSGGCDLEPMADQIMTAGSIIPSATKAFVPRVRCSDQLPYTVEVGASFGDGHMFIFGQNTGEAEIIQFLQPGAALGWGLADDGEGVAGIGNGQWQSLAGSINFNVGTTWRPAADTYLGTTYVQLIF